MIWLPLREGFTTGMQFPSLVGLAYSSSASPPYPDHGTWLGEGEDKVGPYRYACACAPLSWPPVALVAWRT